VIRRDGASESERFLDRARDVDVEHFPGGYTRTVVTRRDGTQIYTVRNQYGDIVTRTRVSPNGRQAVLIDNRDFYRDGRRPRYGHYDRDLPPLRVDIPRDQYVVETSRYGRDDIRAALLAPPVEAVEHAYSLEDVRTSQRLRDKLRRVDLNTITFDFGSAAISPSQFEALAEVGSVIEDILARSPNELFLLEGYTDAVGSPTANLILSDQRAEAIAVALSSNFAIPPENLIIQGYGEQYLKVATQEAERENRRVTVRRITPLVAQSGVTAQ
jgi:outer membrane protein OmpA-like peptidoglycan-associated protein